MGSVGFSSVADLSFLKGFITALVSEAEKIPGNRYGSMQQRRKQTQDRVMYTKRAVWDEIVKSSVGKGKNSHGLRQGRTPADGRDGLAVQALGSVKAQLEPVHP